MKKIATVVAASFLLAACASNPKVNPQPSSADEKQMPTPQVVSSVAPMSAAQTGSPSQSEIESKRLAESQKLAAQQKALDKKSVYFDFDKSAVKPEYQNTVEQQIEWMKAHKNDSVTVEGNADERGSNEYNLALGSRRASAVHKAMVMLGISSDRINDVSFGEEKPRAACHDEKCWQENRRADFVHKLKEER